MGINTNLKSKSDSYISDKKHTIWKLVHVEITVFQTKKIVVLFSFETVFAKYFMEILAKHFHLFKFLNNKIVAAI